MKQHLIRKDSKVNKHVENEKHDHLNTYLNFEIASIKREKWIYWEKIEIKLDVENSKQNLNAKSNGTILKEFLLPTSLDIANKETVCGQSCLRA